MILSLQEHLIWGQSLSHGQNVFDSADAGLVALAAGARNKLAVRQ